MYRLLKSFPLALFILVSLTALPVLNNQEIQKAPPPANLNVFSFYDHYCQATWFSGGLQEQENQLPCPGDESDDRGFVRQLGAGYTLETNQIPKNSIETHPRWVTDGYIYGVFNLQSLGLTLREGDCFVSKVGFLKDATMGKVRFSLWYDSKPTQPGGETLLKEQQDQYDGKLRKIEVDLSAYAGASGALLLRVDALGSSGQDWAVWVDPHIERQLTPTPKATSTQPPPTIYPTPTFTLIPSLTETLIHPPYPTTEAVTLDETPPTFISDPAPDQKKQNSTRICWTTDEPTTGNVFYDFKAGKPSFSLEDQTLARKHCLTLTNLQPTKAYQFIVQAQDPSGNSATSRRIHFLTASHADDESPVMELFAPEILSGKVKIKVDAMDNIGIDRVIFFMDDVTSWTDFSFPFEWDLDTQELEEGDHVIAARVFDTAGNAQELTRLIPIENHLASELSPVQVMIENPTLGAEVSGVVEIRAHITHENNLEIEKTILKINGEEVLHLRYFNPFSEDRLPGSNTESEGDITLRYMWDTRDYDEGETIVLEVQARDAFENAGHAGIRVVKAEEPPIFEIERTVICEGHYFHVDLTVHNTGTSEWQDAHDILIEDISKDYQAASGMRMTQSSYSYEHSTVTVSQFFEVLPAGDSVIISYDLVPVLLDPMDTSYTIGRTTSVSYKDAEDHENIIELADPYIPGDLTAYPLPLLPEEIGGAFASVKFIIITDPERLFHDYDDANFLLSTLASFAIKKQAVLGYRRPGEYWHSGTTLKDNLGYTGMGYSGDWANRLDDAFLHEGYVLLVGETNIIPSFNVSGFNLTMGGTVYTTVRDSDLPYADIWAEDGWPELRVGRVLGRSSRELIESIHAYEAVALGRKSFDLSHALLVTGHEGTWEGFINTANMIAANMESHGIEVEFVHTEYYTTLEQLLREALVICGDFECTGIPGHNINGTPCPRTHPPTALATLQALTSKMEAEQIEEDRRGISGTYDTSYSNICDAADASSLMIKRGAVDADLIYWFGHGSPSSWGWALDNFVSGECGLATEMYLGGPDEPSITPLRFGLTAPLIFASSCLTGNYRGEEAFSRAMFNRQAAIYIGSTEVSPSGHLIGKEFFEQFLEGSPTVGEALTAVKRDRVRSSQMWRFVCYEYNLYGDPTFGGDRR